MIVMVRKNARKYSTCECPCLMRQFRANSDGLVLDINEIIRYGHPPIAPISEYRMM